MCLKKMQFLCRCYRPFITHGATMSEFFSFGVLSARPISEVAENPSTTLRCCRCLARAQHQQLKKRNCNIYCAEKNTRKKTQRALSHLSVGRSVCGDRAQRRGVGVVWWQCDVMKNTTSEGDGEKSDRRTWKCGEHSHIYDFYKS